MIWEHKQQLIAPFEEDATSKFCIFCQSQMVALRRPVAGHGQYISICNICGWWNSWQQTWAGTYDPDTGHSTHWSMYGAIGVLKELSQNDNSVTLEEVRQYLIAKYDGRSRIHPRRMEEVVASIFKAEGYHVAVTAYQNDGGIDVILENASKNIIGVQVKRTSNSIEAEQIRAFGGALLIGGYTRGIFVTTSQYTRGAIKTADSLTGKGIPVELVDSGRLYSALKITQRPLILSLDDWYDFYGDIELSTIYENESEE